MLAELFSNGRSFPFAVSQTGTPHLGKRTAIGRNLDVNFNAANLEMLIYCFHSETRVGLATSPNKSKSFGPGSFHIHRRDHGPMRVRWSCLFATCQTSWKSPRNTLESNTTWRHPC